MTKLYVLIWIFRGQFTNALYELMDALFDFIDANFGMWLSVLENIN